MIVFGVIKYFSRTAFPFHSCPKSVFSWTAIIQPLERSNSSTKITGMTDGDTSRKGRLYVFLVGRTWIIFSNTNAAHLPAAVGGPE
jgi:hypothetical protein